MEWGYSYFRHVDIGTLESEGLGYGEASWGDYDGDGDLDIAICGLKSGDIPDPQRMRIFRNDGGDSFSYVSGLALEGVQDSSLEWGDYNNDGLNDLAVCGLNEILGPITYVYEMEETVDNYNHSSYPESVANGGMAWGDYDNDGDFDLAIFGDTAQGGVGTGVFAGLYRNDSGELHKIDSSIEGIYNGDMEWGDYDNDGNLDLVTCGNKSIADPHAMLYKNDGNGTITRAYSEDTENPMIIPVMNGCLAWGDYDNDGDLDLVVGGEEGYQLPSLRIYKNTGNGTHGLYDTPWTLRDMDIDLTGIYSGDVEWADYDSDGDLDLIVCGRRDYSIGRITRIYRNDGNDIFVNVMELTGLGDSSLEIADYDNDGDIDLLVSGTDSTGVDKSTLYRNDNSVFIDISAGITAIQNGDMSWGDYDSDGDLDLAVSGSGASKIYRNFGNDSLIEDINISLTPLSNSSLQWIDYDNDGDMDLMMMGSDDLLNPIFRIFKNNNAPVNAAPTPPTSVNVSYNTTEKKFKIRWQKGTDAETPQDGLDYEVVFLAAGESGPEFILATTMGRQGTVGSGVFPYKGTYSKSRIGSETGVNIDYKGLVSEARHYCVIRTVDPNKNRSDWSSVLDLPFMVSADIGDIHHPAAIPDLSAQPGTTEGKISLSFSAPGDQEWRGRLSTGSQFAIQYSTNSSVSWSTSTPNILYPEPANVELPFDPKENVPAQDAITGLPEGTTWYMKMWTKDKVGHWSDISNTATSWAQWDVTPPEKITTITAIKGENEGEVILTWSSPGDDGWEGILSSSSQFKISAGQESNVPPDYLPFVPLFEVLESTENVVPQSIMTHTITGLSPYGWIEFHVSYADEKGNWGNDSFPALTYPQGDVSPPGKVTDFTAITGDDGGAVNFYWTSPGDDLYSKIISSGSSFNIQYSTWEGVVWSSAATENVINISTSGVLPSTAVMFTINKSVTDLLYDTSYYFAIWYIDEADNDGMISDTTMAWVYRDETSPGQITDLSASQGFFGGEVDLSWSMPGDNLFSGRLPEGSQYVVQIESWNAIVWSTYSVNSTTYSETSYGLPFTFSTKTIAGLAQGSTRYFAIWYADSDLNWSLHSNTVSVIVPYNDNTPPADVISLAALPGATEGKVDLSWAMPGDDGWDSPLNPGSQFRIDYSAQSGDLDYGSAEIIISTYGVIPGTTVHYEVDISTPGELMYFAVWHKDETGNYSSISNIVSTEAQEDVTPPGQVTDLLAVPGTRGGQINLSWNSPGDDGHLNDLVLGSKYSIQYSTWASFTPSTANAQISKSITDATPPHTFTECSVELLESETYYFRIWYCDEAENWSVISDTISVVAKSFTNKKQEQTFPPGVNLEHSAVSWGNYNGDSYLDFVICGRDGDNLVTKILKNNGNGTFSDINASIIGVEYGDVDWGDYDDDGDLDLAVCGISGGGERITRIYKSTNGIFVDANIDLPNVSGGAIKWGDFDFDDDLDIALCGSGQATVYRNDSGTFTAISSVFEAVYDGSLAWGDFDRDDDLDIAFCSSGMGVNIYRNDDGSFVLHTNIGINGEPKDLEFTDYYSKSLLAVAIVGGAFDDSRVYQYNSSSDDFSQTSTFAQGDSVDLGDYDGSTEADIAVCGGDITELDKSIAYDFYSDKVSLNTVVSEGDIEFGDCDNDGDLDILISGSGSLSLYENVATTFSAGAYSAIDEFKNAALAIGDLNNDDYFDFVMSGTNEKGDSYIKAYLNNSKGLFTSVNLSFEGIENGDISLGDYDSDGDLDIFVSGGEAALSFDSTKIFRNNGGTSFSSQETLTTSYNNSASDLGDYDNDGDLDLIICGYGTALVLPLTIGEKTAIYQNNKGSFDEIDTDFIGVSNGDVVWADYDNDGYLDFAVCGQDENFSPVSKIYRNEGDGVFTDINVAITAVMYSALAWGDYDNDGDLDLSVSGQIESADFLSARITKIYRNDVNSGGTFSDINAGLEGLTESSLSWGDYDNDGDLDLAASGDAITQLYAIDIISIIDTIDPGTFDPNDLLDADPYDLIDIATSTIKIYENMGSDVFAEKTDIVLPDFTEPIVAWADMNGDDRLDLFICGAGESGAYLFEGYMENSAPHMDIAPTFANWIFPDRVIFTFQPGTNADDETPINGLKYDIRISTSPMSYDGTGGAPWVVSPSMGGGISPNFGNTSRASKTIDTTKTYASKLYYQYRVIDTGYKKSPWTIVNTVNFGDRHPPGAVTTLHTEPGESGESSIYLDWYTPGDDSYEGDLSIGTEFRIQYSTWPEVAWSTACAQVVDFSTCSKNPGTYISSYTISSVSGITESTLYYLKLWHQDESDNWSEASNIASGYSSADATQPAAVTDLVGQTSLFGGEIDLNWSMPGDDGLFNALLEGSEFRIQYSEWIEVDWWEEFAQVRVSTHGLSPGTSVSYTVTGLGSGTTYYIKIWHIDADQNVSPLSNTATNWAQVFDTVAPSSAQVNVSLMPTQGDVKLSWTIPGDDNDEGNFYRDSQYRIQYSTLETVYWSTASAQIIESAVGLQPLTTTSYTITNLTVDTTYHFSIWHCDEVPNWSSTSSIVSFFVERDTTAPSSISDLSANLGLLGGEIDLSWSTPGDDNNTVTLPLGSQFALQYSTWAEVGWSTTSVHISVSTSGVQPSTTVHYTVTGLEQGLTYYFQIRYADEVPNWSGISNMTSYWAMEFDETPPAKITDLSASAGTFEREIVLNWSAPGNDGWEGSLSDGSQFKIQYSTLSEITWSTSSAQVSVATSSVVPGENVSYLISELNKGETYYFKIWHADEARNYSEVSITATSWAQIDSISPDKVTNLTAYTGSNIREIDLSWNMPGDNGFARSLDAGSEFVIQYSTWENIGWSTAATKNILRISTSGIIPGTQVGYNIGDLVGSTTYYFKIWIFDEDNNLFEGLSNTATSWTLTDSISPSTVWDLTGLTSRVVGAVDLSWSTPGDDKEWFFALTEGSEFAIQYSSYTPPEISTAMAVKFSTHGVLPTTVVHHTITGLQLGTSYSFVIWHKDAPGNWSSSSTLISVYSQIGDTIAPAAVDTLTSEDQYEGEIFLQWNVPGDDDLLLPLWEGSQFAIQRKESENGTGIVWSTDSVDTIITSTHGVTPGTAMSYTLTGLTPDSTYFMRIWHMDEVSNWSYESNLSSACVSTDQHAPSSVNLSAETGDNNGEVKLTWNAPGDNDVSSSLPLGSEFTIQYSTWEDVAWSYTSTTDTITVSTSGVNPGTEVSYVVTGLVPDILYYLKAWHHDEVPNWSNASNIISIESKTFAPTRINFIFANQEADGGQIRLRWFHPSDDTSDGKLEVGSKYAIQSSTWGEVEWSTSSADTIVYSTSNVAPNTLVSHIVKGLIPDQQYYMRVWYADSSGNWSLPSVLATEISGDSSLNNVNTVIPGLFDGTVAWGDYDNDGDLDIAVCGSTSATEGFSGIFKNNNDGTFMNINAGLTTVRYGALAWGDYDNDGDLDLAISGATSELGQTRYSDIYRNDGNDTFVAVNAGLTGVYAGSMAWGDYDNDGYLDLAICGDTIQGALGIGPLSKIYHNNRNGTFSDSGIGIENVSNGTIAWADYNSDGNLDIAICGQGKSRIYANYGSGVFSDIDAGLSNIWFGSLAWGDYDSDGDMDLALVGGIPSWGTYIPVLRVYKNEGSNTFTSITSDLQGAFNSELSWGDYDSDGKLDLAVMGSSSAIIPYRGTILYKNIGGDNFEDITTGLLELHGSNGSIAFGDYDNDGDLDIAMLGQESTIVGLTRIYRNSGVEYNSNPLPPTTGFYNIDNNSNGDLELSWGDGFDETTLTVALHYEVISATNPTDVNEGVWTLSPTTGRGMTPFVGHYPRKKVLPGKNEIKVDRAALIAGETYYWQVRTIDSGFAKSGWSDIQAYQLHADTPIFIYNSFTDIDATHVTFNWDKGANSPTVEYYSEAATNATFDENISSSGWVANASNWVSSGLAGDTTYSFRVKARNTNGIETGWLTIQNTVRTLVEPPTDIILIDVTTESVTATWTNGPGNPPTIEYLAQRATDEGFTQDLSSSAWVADMSTWTATGLVPGTTYYFRAQARNSESSPTEWCQTASTVTLANPPTNIALDDVRETEIDVSWMKGSSNSVTVEYLLQWTTSNFSTITSSSPWTQDISSWTATDLIPDTTYMFRVGARNSGGTQTDWETIGSSTRTLAQMPTFYDLVDVSTDSVVLVWSKGSNPSTVEYIAELATNEAFDQNLSSSGWIADISSWTISGLNINTTYYFRIKAQNSDNIETIWTQTLSTVTLVNPPTNLNYISVNALSAELGWQKGVGNPSTIEYLLQWTTSSFSTITSSSPWTQDISNWTATNLIPDTTYMFRVGARNSGGTQTDWETIGSSTRTLAQIPTDANFDIVTSNSLDVSWNISSNPVTVQYLAQIATNESYGQNLSSSGWMASISSWTFAGLTVDTTYSFRVKARNSDNTETNWHEILSSTRTLVETPTSLNLPVVSTDTIQAVWDKGVNNPPTVEYLAQLDTNVNFDQDLSSSGWVADMSTWTPTGLMPCTTYYFRVKAQNSDFTPTPWTGIVSTATLANPPTNFYLTDVASGTIRAVWQKGYGGPAYYLVQISTDISFPQAITNDSSLLFDTTNWLATGLTHETSYYLRVRAQNPVGAQTDWTTTLSAFTLEDPPLALDFDNINYYSVRANWYTGSNPDTTEYLAEWTHDGVTFSSSDWVVNGTSWTATGLTPGTTYQFNIYQKPPEEFCLDLGIVKTLTIEIHSIEPSLGYNTGIVHISSLSGVGFFDGMEVKLTKSSESAISGTGIVIIDSHTLECDFDLTAAATGAWNVVASTGGAGSLSDILVNGFSVYPMVVTSIDPDRGTDNAVVDVSIGGEGFVSGTQVKMTKTGEDDISGADIVVVDTGTITCKFDLVNKATGYWSIEAATGTVTGVLIDCFIIEAMDVDSINPNSGINNEVVDVTIGGYGFVDGTQVEMKKSTETIAGTNVVVVATDTITCKFDLINQPTGYWSVVVTTGAAVVTLADGFYVEAMQINSINPDNGSNNVVIDASVSGIGFVDGMQIKLAMTTQPDIDGTDIVVVDSQTLTCKFDLINKLTGYWDITITTGAVSNTLSNGFNIGPMSVISIDPNIGVNNESISATINGTGFVDGTQVEMKKSTETITGTSVVIVDSSTITCDFNLVGKTTGYWTLTLTTGTVNVSLIDGFDLIPMKIISIDPTSASNNQILNTSISGQGFVSGMQVKMKMSGQTAIDAANVVVSDSSTLTCDFDLVNRVTGYWNVEIATGPVTDTLVGAFSVDPMQLLSISPDSATNNRVIASTITGSGFINGISVKILKAGCTDVIATEIVIVDSTTITCKFDLVNINTGYWNVNVSTGVVNKTLINALNVGIMSISSISPDNATNSGLVSVTIYGDGFVPGSNVKLKKSGEADIVAQNVIAISTNQINCDFELLTTYKGIWTLEVSTVVNSLPFTALLTDGFTIVDRRNSAEVFVPKDSGATTTITPETGDITLDISPNSFEEDVTVTISTDTVAASNQDSIGVTTIGIKIETDKGLQPIKNLTITLRYTDAVIAGLDESMLIIARYNEEYERWIPLPSTVYPDENKVVAVIDHLSRFALVYYTPAANLSNVNIFPNPYNPLIHSQGFTIENITEEAEIKLFTISGEFVADIEYTSQDGRTKWYGKNHAGMDVCSGVYILYIKGPNGTRILKVAVEK
ncbi:FG-GAP-like repeat-containing protein [Elusimicrobiota bacterium]